MPKVLTKFEQGHQSGSTKWRWGGLKSATFDK